MMLCSFTVQTGDIRAFFLLEAYLERCPHSTDLVLPLETRGRSDAGSVDLPSVGERVARASPRNQSEVLALTRPPSFELEASLS